MDIFNIEAQRSAQDMQRMQLAEQRYSTLGQLGVQQQNIAAHAASSAASLAAQKERWKRQDSQTPFKMANIAERARAQAAREIQQENDPSLVGNPNARKTRIAERAREIEQDILLRMITMDKED